MVMDDELLTEAIVHRFFTHAGAEPAMKTLPPAFQLKLNSTLLDVTAVPDTFTEPVMALNWPLTGVMFHPPQKPLLGKQPLLESLAQAAGKVPAGLPPRAVSVAKV